MSSVFTLGAQTFNRSAVAASSWLVYDVLMTYHKEVRYIWCSAWSLPKALYLFSRYAGLALSISFLIMSTTRLSEQVCRAYTSVASIGIVVVTIPADGLLLMRVRSLFEHRRVLCRVLLIYYIVEKLVELAIVCVASRFEADVPSPSDANTTGCFFMTPQQPADALPALFPALLYNSILFGLTLAKLYPYWPSKSSGMSPLLNVFVRDGAIYFGMICCLLALEIILPLCITEQVALANAVVPWILTGYPIASCRMLLHLRGSVSKPFLNTAISAHVATSAPNLGSTQSSVIDIGWEGSQAVEEAAIWNEHGEDTGDQH